MTNKIIDVTPNKSGRLIVRLYGRDFDVTDTIANGKNELLAFGEVYKLRKISGSTPLKVKDWSEQTKATHGGKS